MEYRREESIANSIFIVCCYVMLVASGLLIFPGKLPGLLIATVIIIVLEYARYKSSVALFKIVFVDELTGLPNMDHMNKVVADKIDNGDEFCLAVFDINGFKLINDTLGFEQGDNHLRYIGDKLKEYANVFEFACRCDNDNFAIVIKGDNVKRAGELLDKLFGELSCLQGSNNYHVQYSCGVVAQNGEYDSVNILFDYAKIAKSIGKKENHTKIVVYDEELKNEMIRRQQLKDDLQDALDNGEFMVYLQPKYNLQDDTLAGAEALVRWNYKHKDLLSPAMFVPVFEEDGSIGMIDQFVLRTVSCKLGEWLKQGYELLPISVNVSRVQLTNQNFVNEVAATVEKHGVPFEYIDLELTESVGFDNMAYLLKTMKDIEERGFGISMDDFGTGYSSLGLLQKMPLDILKLDKVFIDDYTDETCEKEKLMICDIINMAHHLGIKVIAEGVETEQQRDMLRDAGCEIVQGYYYSKPIPISEYEALLNKKAG